MRKQMNVTELGEKRGIFMKRGYKTIMCWVGVIALVMLICPISADAQGNIRVGRFKLLPTAKYEIKYDDNIFSALEGADKPDDVIHTVTGAIAVEYIKSEDTPGLELKASYEVAPVLYTDYDNNNYTKQKLEAEIKYTLPSKIWVGLKDIYNVNEDPYGNERDSLEDDEGIRTTGYDNSIIASAGYNEKFKDRFAGEVEYTHKIARNDRFEDAWKDEDNDNIKVSTYWALTPKTAFKAVVGWEMTEYPEQDSGDNNRGYTEDNSYKNDYYYGLVGFSFNPSGKLEGDLLFGYGIREFDNDTDVNGYEFENGNTWVAKTGVTWKATERTKINGKIERGIKSADDVGRNYYDETNLGLGLEQGITEKITFKVDFSYDYLDYNQIESSVLTKEEKTFGGTVGLDYTINKWLKAALKYEGKRKDKEEGGDVTEETDNNRVSLEISGAL